MSGDFQSYGISMGHVRQALGFFIFLRRIILYSPEKINDRVIFFPESCTIKYL